MSTFNFGTITEVESSKNYLKAWSIYDNVKFGGISTPTEGESKDGRKWKKWDITFECPDGIYVESVFEPGAEAAKRRDYDRPDGGKITFPSEIENLTCKFAQILNVYMNAENKKKYETLKAKKVFNSLDFDKFMEIITKLLENPVAPTPENPIQLKLQGRNHDGRVFAKLPDAKISSTDGRVWIPNFLGKNLTLSAYEKKQAESTVQSVPTDMSKIDAPVVSANSDLDNDIADLTSELGL